MWLCVSSTFLKCLCMASITNMIVYAMKLKQKTCTKISGMTEIRSIIVTIRTAHRFMIQPIREVIGKFKDETCGWPIVEFVGLRSEMYLYTER